MSEPNRDRAGGEVRRAWRGEDREPVTRLGGTHLSHPIQLKFARACKVVGWRRKLVEMKWTVKLVAEAGQGEVLEREIATLEREDQVSPASIGLTITEGKNIMESLQRELVTV